MLRFCPSTALVRQSTATIAPRFALAARAFSCPKTSITELSVEDANKASPYHTHARSGHQYEGSAKAEDVGARNEAAFIGYKPTHPDWCKEPTIAFAMPHMVNLLTVAPLSISIVFAAAFFWGIGLWRFYAARHFRSVLIERPPLEQAAQ